MIVINSTGSNISIIEGGIRHYLSPEVYTYLGNPAYTTLPDAEFNAIPAGLQYFPDGMIVINGTGSNIIIQGGMRHYLSPEVYTYLGNPAFTTLPDDEFNAIPTGLQYFPDGMIVQDGSSGGETSIIQGGQKRVVSATILQYLGFPHLTITIIPDDQYVGIPTGLPYVPQGLFVRDAGSGATDIIQGGQKHLVSPEVDSYLLALQTQQIVTIPSSEFNAIPLGLEYWPEGIIIFNKDADAICIIQNGEKCWLSLMFMPTLAIRLIPLSRQIPSSMPSDRPPIFPPWHGLGRYRGRPCYR